MRFYNFTYILNTIVSYVIYLESSQDIHVSNLLRPYHTHPARISTLPAPQPIQPSYTPVQPRGVQGITRGGKNWGHITFASSRRLEAVTGSRKVTCSASVLYRDYYWFL